VAIFLAAVYIVLTKGGALEMQQEHAVETPAHTPVTAPAVTPKK
jgi:hypothetical protein